MRQCLLFFVILLCLSATGPSLNKMLSLSRIICIKIKTLQHCTLDFFQLCQTNIKGVLCSHWNRSHICSLLVFDKSFVRLDAFGWRTQTLANKRFMINSTLKSVSVVFIVACSQPTSWGLCEWPSVTICSPICSALSLNSERCLWLEAELPLKMTELLNGVRNEDLSAHLWCGLLCRSHGVSQPVPAWLLLKSNCSYIHFCVFV